MTPCPVCQRDISESQPVCPHCGAKRHSLIVRVLVHGLLLPGLFLGSCVLTATGLGSLPSRSSNLTLNDHTLPPGRFPLVVVTPSTSDPSQPELATFVWHRWEVWRREHPTDRYSFLLPQEQGVAEHTFVCDAVGGLNTYRDCHERAEYRVTKLSPHRQLIEVNMLRSVVGSDQFTHQYAGRYEAEEQAIHPRFYDGPMPQSSSTTGILGRIAVMMLVPFLVVLAVNRLLPPGLRLTRRNVIKLGIVLAVLWILGAIAIPNFMAMGMRARQSEARTSLGGIYVAELEFHAEHKRYGTLDEIGFAIMNERWTRYTYRIDPSGKPGTIVGPTHSLATPDNRVVSAGLSPDGQHFTATATGNIDDDSTIDQWHVNDAKHGVQHADVDDFRD